MILSNILHTTPSHLKKLKQMGMESVQDLLHFFPRTIESTEIIQQFPDLVLSQKNTVEGKLCDFRRETTPRGKKIAKAALVLADQTTLEVIWFRVPYLLKNIKDEARVFLVGKVDRNYGAMQMSNPEVYLSRDVHIGGLRAIYPESPPITSKWMREKIKPLLTLADECVDILPNKILKEEKFLNKTEAIKAIHRPESVEAWEKARKRLAFEEVFEIQVRVLLEKARRESETQNPCRFVFEADLIKEDLKKLPFVLTLAQKKVLFHILKDFDRTRPAHRLIQGDVGSGKTIVAFLAGMAVVRQGFQFALLAPTEILATQHFTNALKFFGSDVSVELLTGSVPATKKKNIKAKLQNGDIKVLIGTHALLTEDTVFKNLGLAVIDEQHRFGVAQRAALAETHAHMIAMTATPIPRSLALTIYGDQDISVIDELPPGRKSILTRVVHNDKTRQLCERFIEDQIIKGHQIFWVCPLIDESDKLEAKNVMAEFERIAQDVYPKRRVNFLHGKMKSKEKEKIMAQFKAGEFDILVSTSVIEVGVDIPNATVMVIENAERFGLAQLHQFRGRIGRNDKQSYCFLMTKEDAAYTTRLKSMERFQDGFKLAEIDLQIRGMGELYGTRQSGLPDFKCADLNDHETLQLARDWAVKILEEDKNLETYPAVRKAIDSGAAYF